MERTRIEALIAELAKKQGSGMYLKDFLLTWEKTDDEIAATFLAADALRALRE